MDGARPCWQGERMPNLWIRHESRDTERRTPVVPADAARLVDRGVGVTVEESPQRAFPIEDYAAAGCTVVPQGSWVDAPRETFVVGLKELPAGPPELVHRHVMFGHAFKGQHEGPALLRRFDAGGGALLDLEYLTDENGRRLAAFGYWAGYIGAALAVLQHRGTLPKPVTPWARTDLDNLIRTDGDPARALVTGALGRSGRGACDALVVAGLEPTRWDIAETQVLDHDALLAHDILVNGVLVTKPTPPFVTREQLRAGEHRLSVVADVTVDVTSELNLLPIYDDVTTWDEPVLHITGLGSPIDLIAIDNLPSLLPHEASLTFSAELAPHLAELDDGAPWQRCLHTYQDAVRSVR
jgi:saccharopine dehydrogenase (NAD+, L-lysine-forming)